MNLRDNITWYSTIARKICKEVPLWRTYNFFKKFRKRGLTKGKKSGSIHGRLGKGREREAVENEGEKKLKKVLDKADRM